MSTRHTIPFAASASRTKPNSLSNVVIPSSKPTSVKLTIMETVSGLPLMVTVSPMNGDRKRGLRQIVDQAPKFAIHIFADLGYDVLAVSETLAEGTKKASFRSQRWPTLMLSDATCSKGLTRYKAVLLGDVQSTFPFFLTARFSIQVLFSKVWMTPAAESLENGNICVTAPNMNGSGVSTKRGRSILQVNSSIAAS